MKLRLSIEEFDRGLEELSKKYLIFAPRTFEKRGTYSDTDVVRYAKVNNFSEMNWKDKSHFPAKEALLPVNEILFYFTEDEYKAASEDTRERLVFLRACDMNAIKRIDQIYLGNGASNDFFYARTRKKTKFIVVGCSKTFRNCFCVSMGTNKADNYDAAMNIRENEIQLEIRNEDLNVFSGKEIEFDIDYVSKNEFEVDLPEKVDFMYIQNHKMWDEYDSRCIGCGRCNYSCPTCTCFSMQDIHYKENENMGERRRVWASCQVDGYTNIAGGHSFRQKQRQRMRFKTLHKIYDYKKRFGENMCVGCGRCDDMCPQYISISEAYEKVARAMREKDNEELISEVYEKVVKVMKEKREE